MKTTKMVQYIECMDNDSYKGLVVLTATFFISTAVLGGFWWIENKKRRLLEKEMNQQRQYYLDQESNRTNYHQPVCWPQWEA